MAERMNEYRDFIRKKSLEVENSGFECNVTNQLLFDWQRDIVHWALKKGKSAIFADCGLGKTPMQLEWGKQVSGYTGNPVLILAPLAVAKQTEREGRKFHIGVTVCRSQTDVKPGVNVTNYEMLSHFDADSFSGVVLDESSILKDASSATRKQLTEAFRNTPYKLCCTATPSPNDFMELGTHADFLNVMTQPEMLATFFCHDGGNTSKWRLKGHAETKFFEWVASWSCCLTNPADLGYDGSDFVLPKLNVHEVITHEADLEDREGQLMWLPEVSQSLNERRTARRNSLISRVKAAASIANSENGQVLVWCDLNSESEALTDAIDGAVEVRGSHSSTYKEAAMLGFSTGDNRVLVSKPSIAGWGMNWQQCNTMIFVGLSDSFEAYYQAVRRCWRFGQKKPVDVYIVISDAEGCVKQNIERKQADAQRMTRELISYTKNILTAEIHQTTRNVQSYITTEEMEVPAWIA